MQVLPNNRRNANLPMPENIRFSTAGERQLVSGAAGDIELDARLGKSRDDVGTGVLVICHPHPLFGGTMDNKVVTTLARAARDLGVAQVRFNFRGVGKSQGEHAAMAGETEDLHLLLDLLGCQADVPLYLAGFSFGSGVASRASQTRADLRCLHLIAPPVGKYTDTYFRHYPCPLTVYQGSEDEVVDAQATRLWANEVESDCQLAWFEQTGHFFHGRLTDLHRAFSSRFALQSGSAP